MKYIGECKELGIAVVPPDVQVSTANFTPTGDSIRFGLAAIKNVGHNAIDSIIAARGELQKQGKAGFASLWEFCEKVDLRLMNKRVLESLCKAGALDSFGPRACVFAALDKAMERAQKSQKDAAAGQHGLFGMFDDPGPASGGKEEHALPTVPDWDEHTRLQNEKDVLGFFVSGHPMDQVSREAAQPEGGGYGDGVRDEAGGAGVSPRAAGAGKRDPDCRRDYGAEGGEVETVG